jgi:hypothetical protein
MVDGRKAYFFHDHSQSIYISSDRAYALEEEKTARALGPVQVLHECNMISH